MSESAALTQLKALLEPVDFELSADPTIYIYPDDFTSAIPSVSVPFAIIGIHESTDRQQIKQTARHIELLYTIYIRMYTQKGEIVPSTVNFAAFEAANSGIGSKIDTVLLSNPTLNGAVVTIGQNNGDFSLWSYSYMPLNTQIYSGVEYLFNVRQRI